MLGPTDARLDGTGRRTSRVDMDATGRKRRLAKLALKLFAATAVGFVCVELGLRFALFGDSDLARRLGRDLRDP